jgi:heme-degrading monooxygenase HmoA
MSDGVPSVRRKVGHMATTAIDANAPLITLINIFQVEANDQDTLIQLLEAATLEVMQHLPGFVSANIHRGLDGKHVANYAQWASEEDFKRMLANPKAQEHMRRAQQIAKAEPLLYRVASVHCVGG